MLHLVAMQAHAESDQPAWTVDPARPGSDLPAQGASLFDRIASSGDDPQIPFPFERLIARIEAAAGCNETEPCTRAVLIPLGRSLQRAAASPDFFLHPRAVVAVTGGGRGLHLRDRLYLGYQERAGVIEVISYNEALGRFEFQIVKDYFAGRAAKAVYARRAVCIACHQNQGPVFSRQVWLETNANPQVAARLLQVQPVFHGIPARANTDIANAIDDATDRSNELALTQRLWSDGCGRDGPGAACRRGALTAALQFALTGERSYTAGAAFQRGVSDVLARNAATLWPDGLALPSPDIPNRDPLPVANHAIGPTQSHVEARFDALLPRAPLEILPPDGRALSDRLVKGLAGFWSGADRAALERALESTSSARVRRIALPCRPAAGLDEEQLECRTVADASGLWLRARWSRDDAVIEEIGTLAAQPVRYPPMRSTGKASGSAAFILVPSNRHGSPRLPNGDVVQRIELRGTAVKGSLASGEAVVTIREDFASVEPALSTLEVQPQPVGSAIADLVAKVSGGGPVLQPKVRRARADDYPRADSQPVASAMLFESQCGACHHTAQIAPPNFLTGDASRVKRNLQSCAPRILVRLAMQDIPAPQRDKTPMPPELFASPASTGQEQSLAALRGSVEAMLRQEYGRLPTLDELMRDGYEALRPCLSRT